MVCPVCKNDVKEGMNYCAFCGWGMVEDMSTYGSLFSETQIEEYQTRLRLYRKFVGGSSAESKSESPFLDVKQPDEVAGNAGTAGDAAKGAAGVVKEGTEGNTAEGAAGDSAEDAAQAVNMGTQYLARGCTGRNLRTFLNPAGAYGEDETDQLIEDICRRIRDGSFENLEIGDFFDVELIGENFYEEQVRLVFAGFYGKDKRMRDQWDEPWDKPYAVLVTGKNLEESSPIFDSFLGFMWNADQGFQGSYMRNEVLAGCASELRLLPWELLHREGEDAVCLLSIFDIQVVGREDQRLPLFQLNEDAVDCDLDSDGKWRPKRLEGRRPDEEPVDLYPEYWLREECGDRANHFLTNIGSARGSEKMGVRLWFCIG